MAQNNRHCSVWLAEVDTCHYNFKAVGASKASAKEEFARLWQSWRQVTGATIPVGEIMESVRITQLWVGAHLVDGEDLDK